LPLCSLGGSRIAEPLCPTVVVRRMMVSAALAHKDVYVLQLRLMITQQKLNTFALGSRDAPSDSGVFFGNAL
jgi:hypothetical protein